MEELYFIAVVPPNDIREKATLVKEHFRDRYNSRHALKSPPHITLHMPFKWKQRKLNQLLESLQHLAETSEPFGIKLNGFDCFEPRVIFINVEQSEELSELQKQVVKSMRKLNVLNADYKGRPFHPHMTVAFRDLRKSEFHRAWSVFEEKSFEEIFVFDRITLLKHDGKKWQEFEEFPLKGLT